MAEGINVGSVEVSVVPDAREFNPLLQAAIGPASDEAAKQISDAIAKGIRDGLSEPDTTAPAREQGTKAGDSFGNAFQSRVKAALAALPSAEVTLDDEAAQAKLDYLREELTSLKGQRVGVDISDTDAIARLTALRAEMDNLAARSGSVQINADTAAAAAQLDKFFAETSIKAKATGDEVGKDLTDSATKSAGMGSPLIMGAVAAGLIAGGPAVSAAGILAFGGLAAAAAAQVPAVKTAFSSLKTSVMADVQSMGQEIAPTFIAIAGDAQRAFNQVEPAIHQALATVAPEVQAVAQAFEGAAETAIPAFTRAIQGGQPIINGLSTLIRDIGSGVAGLMDALTAHSGAEGSVLSGLGSTLNTLLPMVGTLLGEGAELGSTALPPLAAVLGVINNVLQAIGPLLPGIAAAFASWKIAGTIAPMLGDLAKNLEAMGAKAAVGEALGKGFTVAADGARGLESAMGPIGWAIAGISLVLPALISGFGGQSQAQKDAAASAQSLTDAVNQANGAITEQVRQQAALSAQKDGLLDYAKTWGVGSQTIVDAALGQGDAINQVKAAAAQYSSGQNAAADATNASTSAGMLQRQGFQQNAQASDTMLGKLLGLNGATAAGVTNQQQLAQATGEASDAAAINSQRLQSVSTAASQANTQIGLFKQGLEALTGKAISADDAQANLTTAVINAETATKGQTGALVDANGQLNLHSAAGVAAYNALKQVAQGSDTVISTMEHLGGTTADVTAKDASLRDGFIKTAEKMGFSAGQAQNLANQIYGIPTQRKTEILADTNPAQKAIDDFLNSNSSKVLHLKVSAVAADAGPAALAKAAGLTSAQTAGGSGLANGGVIPGYAPGVDSVPAMLSPGEGVLVPEAVRGIGGAAAIQAINSTYSNRVQGFANGGVVVGLQADTSSAQATVNQEVADAVKLAAKVMSAQANAPGAPSNPSGNAALGKVLAGYQGWGSGSEWNALYALWQRESGWRNTAQNPTSTAYGIPQFLNSTWASLGIPKTSDAAAQINAGLKYIGQRYHDPLGAWAHETKFGWYDQGGLLPPGPSLVYNGTGSPELVAPTQNFQQAMAGMAFTPGGPVEVTGTLRIDGDGLAHIVDGRLVQFADAQINRGAYNG